MQKRLNISGWLAASVLAGLLYGMVPASAQNFTQWGWPQPYEKVSDKSIAWLKEKGWWPLAVGWQGPFSGQNTINVVMDKEGLLQKIMHQQSRTNLISPKLRLKGQSYLFLLFWKPLVE